MKNNAKQGMADRMKAIFTLDLEAIKSKLMDEDGPGWSRERADRCEVEYKQFLAVAAGFPEETVVPSVDVDTFWHAHILDTRRYADDCERALGFFLHHTPHYGARGEDDAETMNAGFARTRQLFESLFGAADEEQAAWCARAATKDDEAAWCARTSARNEKVAWCARASAKDEKAAWCARASAKDEKAAWCARAA